MPLISVFRSFSALPTECRRPGAGLGQEFPEKTISVSSARRSLYESVLSLFVGHPVDHYHKLPREHALSRNHTSHVAPGELE